MYKHLEGKRTIKKRNKNGFTLLELIIVIAIIAIIIAIASFTYSQIIERAKITAHNANVRSLEAAGQMFYLIEKEAVDIDESTYSSTKFKEFLNEWPELPKLNSFSGQTGYKITITAEGEVAVTPGSIKK